MSNLFQEVKDINAWLTSTSSEACDSVNNDAIEKIQAWIEVVLDDDSLPNFPDSTKSGIVLCKVANKIYPGAIKQFNQTEPLNKLKQWENAKIYLNTCWYLGVPDDDFFAASDLQKAKNVNNIIRNILSLVKHGVTYLDSSDPLIDAAPPKPICKERIPDFVNPDSSNEHLRKIKAEIINLNKQLKDHKKKLEGLEKDKLFLEDVLINLRNSNKVKENKLGLLEDKNFFENKGKNTSEYLYYDGSLSDAKNLKSLIDDILLGKEISLQLAAQYQSVLASVYGRRLFVWILNRYFINTTLSILSESGFKALLYLLNVLFAHIGTNNSAHYFTLQSILDIAPNVKHETNDNDLTNYLKGRAVWSDKKFWRDYFFQYLLNQSEFKNNDNSFTEDHMKAIVKYITKFVKEKMVGWTLWTRNDLLRFGAGVGKFLGLQENHLELIKSSL